MSTKFEQLDLGIPAASAADLRRAGKHLAQADVGRTPNRVEVQGAAPGLVKLLTPLLEGQDGPRDVLCWEIGESPFGPLVLILQRLRGEWPAAMVQRADWERRQALERAAEVQARADRLFASHRLMRQAEKGQLTRAWREIGKRESAVAVRERAVVEEVSDWREMYLSVLRRLDAAERELRVLKARDKDDLT